MRTNTSHWQGGLSVLFQCFTALILVFIIGQHRYLEIQLEWELLVDVDLQRTPVPNRRATVHSGPESFLLDWAVIKHQSIRKLASLLSLLPDQRPHTLHPVLYTTSVTYILYLISNFKTALYHIRTEKHSKLTPKFLQWPHHFEGNSHLQAELLHCWSFLLDHDRREEAAASPPDAETQHFRVKNMREYQRNKRPGCHWLVLYWNNGHNCLFLINLWNTFLDRTPYLSSCNTAAKDPLNENPDLFPLAIHSDRIPITFLQIPN